MSTAKRTRPQAAGGRAREAAIALDMHASNFRQALVTFDRARAEPDVDRLRRHLLATAREMRLHIDWLLAEGRNLQPGGRP